MTQTLTPDTHLATIDDLLDRERDALRAGRFDQIEKLVGLRETHVAALHGAIGPDDTDAIAALQAIQRKAQRNARLLSAAQEGFRAGTRRLEEIDDVRRKLSTYSENGHLSDKMKSRPSVEKKA